MSRTFKDQPTTVQAAHNGEAVAFVDAEHPSIVGEKIVGKDAKEVLLGRRKDQYDDGEKEPFILVDQKDEEDKHHTKVEPRSAVKQQLHEMVKDVNSIIPQPQTTNEYVLVSDFDIEGFERWYFTQNPSVEFDTISGALEYIAPALDKSLYEYEQGICRDPFTFSIVASENINDPDEPDEIIVMSTSNENLYPLLAKYASIVHTNAANITVIFV